MSMFTGNEVAIVTGASSGIGAGTAVKLVQKGVSKLCLTGLILKDLEETEKKCIQESGNSLTEDDFLLVEGKFYI